MKLNHNKICYAVENGYKLPRKVKKAILGKRISKCKLKRLLKSVKIIETANTMYERTEIEPFAFCPNCGSRSAIASGNKVSYPEHWEDFNCIRCGYLVGEIDNSPFIHALQCKDFEL